MKILFVTHYDNMYGANNALLKLAVSLANEDGYEVMAVVPVKGALTACLEENGIRCVICGVTQWQATYVSPIRQVVKKHIRKKAIKKEIKFLYEMLKDEHIDVIHSNSSVIGHGAMLAKLLGAKHIWHIREFSKEHFNMRYFYPKNLVRNYYESADALVCISDALLENYKCKYPGANVVRIYDGVDKKQKATGQGAHNDDIVRFVYVGYLYQKKHQLEVIEACNKLRNISDTAFEMIFAGDGKDDYKSLLTQKIDEYKLDNVKLAGYVEDVDSLVGKCDVGIIASEYEGFGLVTVEYMLNNLPVIGYSSGGTREIVDDGNTGILYKDEEELVEAMRILIEDRNLRMKYGNNGLERALREFSEDRNVSQIKELYKKLG